MDTQEKVRKKPDGWKALFRTIGALHLPWLWIAVGLGLNLVLNNLLLELPDTTADLLGGQLDSASVTKAILYYVVLGLVSCVAMVGQVQAQTYSVKRARDTVWKKMLGMKMAYFDQNDPSDLMSAIINDSSSAVTDMVNAIVNLIPDIYYVVAALLRINQYHWILSLSCFALLPLKYIYSFLMGRKVQVGTAKIYDEIGRLTSFLADRINHLPLIKTYTNEAEETENGKSVAHKLLRANMKLVHLDNISTGIVAVLDVLQKFVVIVVAVILLQRKEITIATWLAFFLFAQNLFPNMDAIFDAWIRVKGVHGSFRRVIEIMDGEAEKDGAAVDFPATGDIRFQDVTFTYPGTDTPALSHVSFTIPRGSSAAIVGLCGSGKTTSVSLLERFYTPESGKIYIGNTDVEDIALAQFRKNFAYVQQGAEVFSGTLREALTYGIERNVTDEEILDAAEKTGFGAYLQLCGNCLDTPVASGGMSMSGGQSQRLVLTREVLRGGEIVLMDEPTSALDVRVSAKIQDTMDAVFAGKTRILITHDLSFAQKYQRILVMKGGKLVGNGTHAELMQTCETYRNMVEHPEEAAV